MGFRITTNMVVNKYQYNLMKSNGKLSKAIETASTKRNFNRYAEDPIAASKAFKLRREYYDASSQLANNETVSKRFNNAWGTLGGIQDDLEKLYINDTIRGANDATGSARRELGTQLKALAESVVESMNTQYGDRYVFGGEDSLNVPFVWSEDGKTLYYRGIDVNLGSVPKPFLPDEQHYITDDYPDGTTNPEYLAAMDQYNEDLDAYNKDQELLEKYGPMIDKLSKDDHMYIDLGLGMAENEDGKLIESTAFDSSIPGINAIGYGTDEDGLPNNLAVILKEMGEIFSRCSDKDGKYASDEDEARYKALFGKLEDAKAKLDNAYTEIAAQDTFLKSNGVRLTDVKDSLNQSVVELEQVDLADAFQNYLWEQMCYNSALKIGSQLLSPSLLDYMN